MDPHLARKPARCDVTRLKPGLPELFEFRHMEWTRWNKHPVGRGLITADRTASA